MAELFGSSISELEAALHYRVLRQAVLASNVANADTPRFRARELRFEAALAQAGAVLRRTHPAHLEASDGSGGRPWRLVAQSGPARPDGNTVNLDRMLVELDRNASAFREASAMLSRLIALRRTAVMGEGG